MTYSALLRFFVIALPVLLAACAKPAYQARGYASYIADQYAGHYTTSGEIYQPQGWTAAHNTLPFGTVVKVKNNYNGRSVNVTVNDRFPYYPNRVINLSRRAAEYIQIPYHQLSDVTVTADTLPSGAAPAQGYAAAPSSSYGAPASYNTPPPTSYRTPTPARPKARTNSYTAPAPQTYRPAPAPTYRSNPTTIPPAGSGTMAPPAGLPPPPPGYGGR
ncbi:septal ring lytic transglycosylase RlpA family protein [Prosthecobacter sp.]|uniref:septal ring lytic transglycosylase RlpA family protein n=1 Tax=Prosthecobacter sp. TaxID=1965333 RepID=UPI003784AF3A